MQGSPIPLSAESTGLDMGVQLIPLGDVDTYILVAGSVP